MGQHTTTSERIDELPVLVYGLKQMRVDEIIDSVLGPPHGNWDGLSYGEVALVFITHIVMRCTHFLSPVEAWAAQHLTSLSQARGKPVRVQDCSNYLRICGITNGRTGGPMRFTKVSKTLRFWSLAVSMTVANAAYACAPHSERNPLVTLR